MKVSEKDTSSFCIEHSVEHFGTTIPQKTTYPLALLYILIPFAAILAATRRITKKMEGSHSHVLE